MRVLYYKIYYRILGFFKGVKNLIKWFPFIWKLRYFDYSYMTEFLIKYLQEMSKYMKSNESASVESDVVSEKAKMLSDLMQKVYDQDYVNEAFDDIESKWGEGIMQINFTPAEEDGFSKMEFEYNKYHNHLEIEEYINQKFEEKRARQDRAHKLLWKLFEHNILKLWD